jgi:2-oxoglutarate ferredoxin oxidoreductase subunit gamma
MRVLIAGHGGQGILLLGDYVAYVAMLGGKHVAYTPSYGPETRGGKAKCYVIISNGTIDNPIAEEPDVEMIMNQPSMDFLGQLHPGGSIIYNESLVDGPIARVDVRKLAIPATEIADNMKRELRPSKNADTKMFANAVMFGAFLESCAPQTNDDQIKESIKHFLAAKKEDLMPLNYLAITKGRKFASQSSEPHLKRV